jgi:lipid II:glycine glycyltransferase (peptidoglycan interpeptide bridge formation enzyme)
MRMLHARFPDEIALYAAYDGSELLAGIVMYETPTVAHAQYTASSEKARVRGALDFLFVYLITEVYRDKPYFDFGVSTESDGQVLNEGLASFKEGFGGRTVLYDFYTMRRCEP